MARRPNYNCKDEEEEQASANIGYVYMIEPLDPTPSRLEDVVSFEDNFFQVFESDVFVAEVAPVVLVPETFDVEGGFAVGVADNDGGGVLALGDEKLLVSFLLARLEVVRFVAHVERRKGFEVELSRE
jgi:hypothetical protein